MNASAPATVKLAVRSKPNWLRTPQRVWLRRAIFQLHLWVGIILSLYCVVIGLSGSALVFRQEIDDLLHPQVAHLHSEMQRASIETTIHSIEAARPGWRGVGLEDLDKNDRATILLMRPKAGAATTDYRLVSFHPFTGQVLLDRMRYSGFLGWITNLHFYLLAGETGLMVSGCMAIALLLLCASGLILWWPGVRRWTAMLVLRRRTRWQRTNWDLHVVIGFWCCALLTVVTATGVYFAFPDAVRNVVVFATGGGVSSARPAKKKSAHRSNKILSVDQAILIARKALPVEAPPSYFYLPDLSAASLADYSATGYYAGSAPYSQLAQVSVDSRSGEVVSRSDTRKELASMRIIQYFFALHFGSFGGASLLGVLIKLLWVMTGISPAWLAVTGLLMYWNRKLNPLWIRWKRSLE